MTYLKRKADDDLRKWKMNENRDPLVIEGARQVGKTRTIREFARGNYDSFIELNFAKDDRYRSIIDKGYSADNVTNLISLIDPSMKFIPGKTLIYFDEIQEFPEIATSLKFFK